MDLLLFLPALLLAIVTHEYAHGYAALRQGDDTAYMLGRVSMNPIRHIDPVGSIIVPMLLWVSKAGFLLGWARPVPVNPRNYRNYRRGDIIVSLAGIAANLLLAVLFTALLLALVQLKPVLPGLGHTIELAARMAQYGILINLVLAFFNLIPIPPLDGSHVLYHLLPPRLGARYREVGRYGILILIGIIWFAPGGFRLLLLPVWWLMGLVQAVAGPV
jgi:Zn-dependent protease